jgi:hypothetical protein
MAKQTISRFTLSLPSCLRADQRPAHSRRHHHTSERPPIAFDPPHRPTRRHPIPEGPRQGAQAACRCPPPARSPWDHPDGRRTSATRPSRPSPSSVSPTRSKAPAPPSASITRRTPISACNIRIRCWRMRRPRTRSLRCWAAIGTPRCDTARVCSSRACYRIGRRGFRRTS